jgi:hypothetical protein
MIQRLKTSIILHEYTFMEYQIFKNLIGANRKMRNTSLKINMISKKNFLPHSFRN